MEQSQKEFKSLLFPLVILILIAGGYFYFARNPGSQLEDKQSTEPSFKAYTDSLNDDVIICEFKVSSIFAYENIDQVWSTEDRKIYYETSIDGPMNITFVGLSSSQPTIKGNNGDAPLITVKNDNEEIILVEENAYGELFTYTIFKQEKVAIWTKAYKLIETPYATTSMGYCY